VRDRTKESVKHLEIHIMLCRILLQSSNDYSGALSEDFTTLFFEQALSFPYATCGSYACSGTPYSMTVVTDQPGQVLLLIS
jgi:hypothetical protein